MNKVEETAIRENGRTIHFVPSRKFKTLSITAKFKAPLERGTITRRALLPYILKQGTKNYPSTEMFQKKLDELYGAVLSVSGGKKGENHIITLRLELANEKFIAGEANILKEGMDLLNELIFLPNADGGKFDEQIVTREKDTLMQKIDAIKDDKMSYANMRLIDEMCEGEAYQLHVQGYAEDLEKITAENLYDYHQTIISEDQLDVYVLGDFDEEEMKAHLSSLFQRSTNHTQVNAAPTAKNQQSNVQEMVEKLEVQQAKLHIGYRTNITYRDDDYFALQVFNGLFGGFPSSKLFLNVREKHSLAYYASSRLESHKGLLFVVSGIAPEDYKKAKEIIDQQAKAMKEGDFTEEQLAETKDLIVNQLLETMDHPYGIIELLYQQVLGGRELPPDELIAGIKKVTKLDVVQAAEKLQQDTVYLLTSKEASANA